MLHKFSDTFQIFPKKFRNFIIDILAQQVPKKPVCFSTGLIRRQNSTDRQIDNINKNEQNMRNIGRLEERIRDLQDEVTMKTRAYDEMDAENKRLLAR